MIVRCDKRQKSVMAKMIQEGNDIPGQMLEYNEMPGASKIVLLKLIHSERITEINS